MSIQAISSHASVASDGISISNLADKSSENNLLEKCSPINYIMESYFQVIGPVRWPLTIDTHPQEIVRLNL